MMLPGLELDGFCLTELAEVNALLSRAHYLGAARSARFSLGVWADGELVAAQTWRTPAARHLPLDGSWLELSRWCLTPEAGPNAGSRMHRATVRWLRQNAPEATTLVSYSDPRAGHTGSLYRACNWLWAPTWHRLRPPPYGSWRLGRALGGRERQGPLGVPAQTRRPASGRSALQRPRCCPFMAQRRRLPRCHPEGVGAFAPSPC